MGLPRSNRRSDESLASRTQISYCARGDYSAAWKLLNLEEPALKLNRLCDEVWKTLLCYNFHKNKQKVEEVVCLYL